MTSAALRYVLSLIGTGRVMPDGRLWWVAVDYKLSITGNHMIDAQQAVPAKVFTDLTCWSCGEETLKEAAIETEAFSAKGEKKMSTGRKHSDCQ
jgi:hypothetical protein